MLHLPEDIQLCIVEQLSTEVLTAPEHHNAWKTATKTLASLCLTSRGMCALAQPLLYRNFVRESKILEPDTVQGIIYDDIGVKATETLELYIRTLLDRPSLANQVWFVRLQERADEEREDEDDFGQAIPCCSDVYETFQVPEKTSRILDETLLNRCLDSTRRIAALDSELEGQNWHDAWRSDLARGRDDAAIALLLTLVPNLKYLDIQSFHSTFNKHFGMLVKQLLGVASWVKDERSFTANVPSFNLVASMPFPPPSLPFLAHMEGLTLRKRGWSDWDADALYMPLIYITTLKSFNLIDMWDFFKNNTANYKMPPLRNLQHLRVEGVDSCSLGLLTLIESCSRLQSFEYVATTLCFEARIDQKWLDTLAKRANTLKRLQLILPVHDNYLYGTIHFAEQFDLRRLSKLNSLEISQSILLSKASPEHLNFSDLLPASLESLVVREIDDGFTIPLSNFIERWGHKDLPQLRYFELVETRNLAKLCLGNTGSSGSLDLNRKSWPVARAQFVGMCQDAGIRYKIWSGAAKSWAQTGRNHLDWSGVVKTYFSADANLGDLSIHGSDENLVHVDFII